MNEDVLGGLARMVETRVDPALDKITDFMNGAPCSFLNKHLVGIEDGRVVDRAKYDRWMRANGFK